MSLKHCHNCGLCCTYMSSPPFTPDEPRWQRLDELLKIEIEHYLDSPRYDDGGPCLWLDLGNGRCKHYEDRPEVCREFEVGNESCRKQRTAANLTIEGFPVVNEDE